jgi:hypothetical protein
VYKRPDSNDSSTDGLIAIKEGGFWPPLRRALQPALAGPWLDRKWHLVWRVPLIAVVGTVVGTVLVTVMSVWLIFLAIAELTRVAGDKEGDVIVDEKRIATFYPSASTKWKSGNTNFFIAISVTSIAVVFGSIHCIAWPFPFPSGTERNFWRVSSVVITGAPIAAVPLWVLSNSGSWVQGVAALIGVSGAFAYTTSRLSLLVLAFLSLRALPPDAYRSVQWTSFIPHF